MAGTEAAREAIWIKNLIDVLSALDTAFNDSYCCRTDSISLRCVLRGDNQGALALSVNPVYHHRFICEVVNYTF